MGFKLNMAVKAGEWLLKSNKGRVVLGTVGPATLYTAAKAVTKTYAKYAAENGIKTAAKTTLKSGAKEASHGVLRSSAGLIAGGVAGGLVLEKVMGKVLGGGVPAGYDAAATGGYDPTMIGAYGADPYAAQLGGMTTGSLPAGTGTVAGSLDDAWRAYNSLGLA